MKMYRFFTVVALLTVLPQYSQAQFMKKLLNVVEDIVLDKNSSSSTSSSSKPQKQKSKKVEEKETPEKYGAKGKIQNIDIQYINYYTDVPMLNIKSDLLYKWESLGGNIDLYTIIDKDSIPEVTDYNSLTEQINNKLYVKKHLNQSYDDTKPTEYKEGMYVKEAYNDILINRAIYVRGYLVHDSSKKILSTYLLAKPVSNIPYIPKKGAGILSKILGSEVVGIRENGSTQKLYLKVNTWRYAQQINSYYLFFASETPLKVTQLEDLKALTIRTPFGVMNKKGFSATFSEIGYVSIPIPMAMRGKKIYVQGFAITEGMTTELCREIYKEHVAYWTEPVEINLVDCEVKQGMEVSDALAKTVIQSMYADLYGIDKNGNQICRFCDGIGCAECNWRGFINDELTMLVKNLGKNVSTSKTNAKRQNTGSKLNGTHTKTFSNGDKYTGGFLNGMCHGRGTYTWSDGKKYVGEFRYNQLHGRGTYTEENLCYVGEFRNDRMYGQGTLTVEKEFKYKGEFKYNCMEGLGTLINLHNNFFIKGVSIMNNMVDIQDGGEYKELAKPVTRNSTKSTATRKRK